MPKTKSAFMDTFSSYIGKQINIICEGSSVASGKLLIIENDYFVMETRWSDKQYFLMDKLSSFWCPDDKKKND